MHRSPVDPFKLPDPAVGDRKGFRYEVTVPEKEFLALSKSSDNSPLTLLTIHLAKAIQSVHPENKKKIFAGIATDIRKALNCPKSRFSNAYMVFISHSPDQLGQDMERLGTTTRGQIILQTDEGNLRYIHNQILRLSAKIQTADLEEKQRIMREVYEFTVSNPTYAISYVGNPEWGSLGPYIEKEFTVVMGADLFIEVNAAGGKFCLSWMQVFENDAYVMNFHRLLKEEGIDCELCGPFAYEWPKSVLP